MQRRIGMRAGILVLILVLVFVHIVSAATTYNDPQGRFAFTVPDSYVQRYRAGMDVSFRSADTRTSSFDVSVIAQAPGPIPSVDTIVTDLLTGLSSPVYTLGITGVQSTILGGQPARRFDYYTATAGTPVRTHTLEFVATTSKAAYILALSANEGDYDQLLGDTAIVLGSFAFTGTVTAESIGSAVTSGSVTSGSATTGSAIVPVTGSGSPQPVRTPEGIASGVASPVGKLPPLPALPTGTATTLPPTGAMPAVKTAAPAKTRTPVG